MTISSINSSYLSKSYGVSNTSTAAESFAQFAPSSKVGGPPPPPRGGGMDMEAAQAKLQQVDPDLAQKMEDFHTKMDDLIQSGASEDTIRSTMKSQMDSLSDTEKSELDSVFGPPPSQSGGEVHGMRRGGGQDDLISELSDSNPELATKLKGFEDAIKSLKDSGASQDEIQKKMKEQVDSLSDDEMSQIQTAMQTQRARHQLGAYLSSASESSTSIAA